MKITTINLVLTEEELKRKNALSHTHKDIYLLGLGRAEELESNADSEVAADNAMGRGDGEQP